MRSRLFLRSRNPPTTEQASRARIPITRPATAPPPILPLSELLTALSLLVPLGRASGVEGVVVLCGRLVVDVAGMGEMIPGFPVGF